MELSVPQENKHRNCNDDERYLRHMLMMRRSQPLNRCTCLYTRRNASGNLSLHNHQSFSDAYIQVIIYLELWNSLNRHEAHFIEVVKSATAWSNTHMNTHGLFGMFYGFKHPGINTLLLWEPIRNNTTKFIQWNHINLPPPILTTFLWYISLQCTYSNIE